MATKFSSNIDKIKYNFDTGARANRFHVNLHCPKLGLSLDGLRCDAVSLPGRKLTTESWSAYGAKEQFPYEVDNGGEITLSFLCDTGFYDRFIIEVWQSMIFTNSEGTGNSFTPYFEYKDEYVGEIEIHQFRQDDKTALKYKLYEAFPVSYEAMALSSDSADILKFSCNFAYTTFDTEYVDKPPMSALNKGRRMLDILLDTLKVGSRFSGKAGRAMNKLQKLDTAVSRGAAIFGNRGG